MGFRANKTQANGIRENRVRDVGLGQVESEILELGQQGGGGDDTKIWDISGTSGHII